MAEQQAFHPGVSLAGAGDLEALKHQVKAEPGQAGGAPAAVIPDWAGVERVNVLLLGVDPSVLLQGGDGYVPAPS